MVGEELHIVQLTNNFYRDGFRKVLFSFGLVTIAFVLVVAAVLYLYFSKPPPVYFATDNQWRTVAAIPVTEGNYPTDPDLKQWVSNALQSIFRYSFINYDNTLRSHRTYFTDNGWQVFQGLVNRFAAKTMVESTKTFVTGGPDAAPTITRFGLIPEQKRYGWWIQVPVSLSYTTPGRDSYTQSLTLNVLVVRIPTLDNLYGVAIENIQVPNQTIKSFQGGV